MEADNGNSLAAIGFLTALEDADHGWFGGYLVLSHQGRPLEFHCSAPVQPTRAQRILYGPTLRPYLLGEIIGRTLLLRAELPVQAVLTDLPDMLALADPKATRKPEILACVEELADKENIAPTASLYRATEPGDAEAFRSSAYPAPVNANAPEASETPSDKGQGPSLELAGVRLFGLAADRWVPSRLAQLLAPLIEQTELTEPFQRIREAIGEAQRISESSTDDPLDEPFDEPLDQSAAA